MTSQLKVALIRKLRASVMCLAYSLHIVNEYLNNQTLADVRSTGAGIKCLYCTLQTFNSCTSQLDGCQFLVVQILVENMSKNKPRTSMTHVACESKLRSVVKSTMHPCPGNWMGNGRLVVSTHLVQELNVSIVSKMYSRISLHDFPLELESYSS